MKLLHKPLHGFYAVVLMAATTLVHGATNTFSSSGNWTAPAGVTSITVEAWGGGGAGGGATSNPGKGGGGAGGQYAKKVITVTPGNVYPYAVGAGGTGSTGNGGAGGDSTFNTNVVVAKGGAGGAVGANSGAAGAGATTNGVGDLVNAGGGGAAGEVDSNCNSSGSGGGGAGSTGAGGSASGNTGGTGTTSGGGAGGDGANSSGSGNAGSSAGGGGAGACAESGTDQSGGGGGNGQLAISYASTPYVSSMNRASYNPAQNNKLVSWTIVFTESVTGVDSGDFVLVQSGGAVGATITGVAGSGKTWTVTANTGTGTSGTVGLNLVDNDSISVAALVLGGSGSGNGNFTGQTYSLLSSPCTGAANVVFCDDFERSNAAAVGNSWTVTPANAGNCSGATGNTGCAGIDSDVPPFSTYANPRANTSRSMFTRWDRVTVESPTIGLAGKAGAQLSFWMRRGRDTFSECPEASGENYLVQYLASDGNWKILAQYPSSPSADLCDGKIFTPVIELPTDALHAAFKMRFYQPSGSGDDGGGTGGGASGVVGYDYWHMDDVVIREIAAPTFVGPFCENFEAGLGRWSISAEGFTSGNIGDASIGTLAYQSASHELDLRWGFVTASTFKTDLTGVTGNITYWVRSGTTTGRDPATSQNLIAEYLDDTGTWTTLATYLGTAAAGASYNASHVIPTNAKHANFRLRFRLVSGGGYDKSYWHIDDACVGDLLPTADLSLTKTGDAALVPGASTTYTLKAKNNGPAALAGSIEIVDTLPAGLSYFSGTGTGWSCSENAQVVTCNWSGTLANGATAPDLLLTANVGAGVTGSITNTATVTGTANDNVSGNNTASFTSGNFTPAYIFTTGVCADGVALGQAGQTCSLATWSPQVAGQSKTGIYITAVNSAGVPTRLSSGSSTAVGFQFGMSCSDPIANAGVQATFSAIATALPLCAGSGAQPSTWSASSSLTFPAGSPSVATSYAFNYADVGQVELYMRNAIATTQIGTSGNFVVKPAGFVLTGIKCTTADAANCGAGALAMATAGDNPAASVATDGTFIRAGHPFSVAVTALTASGKAKADAGTLINCASTPADCTPNFGKEGAPESVKLAPTNATVGMVTAPDIVGDFGSFVGGTASGSAFSWSEVGIITLTPSVKDGNYLGGGDVVGTPSGKVGRFYPDHFETTLVQGCVGGAFTYSGQPFWLRIAAYKVGGSGATGITTNYSAAAGFSKETTVSGVGANGGITGGDAGAAGFSAAQFSSGATPVLTDASSVLKPTFTFTPVLSAAASVTIRAVDTDGVSSSGGSEGVTAVRSGRVRLFNAYGSELLNLPIPIALEYVSSVNAAVPPVATWLPNTIDTCTVLAASNFSFAHPTGTLAKPNNLVACETALTVSGTAPSQKLLLTKPCVGTPCSGNAGWAQLTLNLGATAVGNHCTTVNLGTGYTGVAATANAPWLQNPAGVNPSARATFGIYKSPLIYRRENY